MNVCDFAISIGTVILILNHLPQIYRNFRYKRTFSQSIIRELMHILGVSILIWAYYVNCYYFSVALSILDILTEIVLIGQVVAWRENDRYIFDHTERFEG